jgi:hypothetical protein
MLAQTRVVWEKNAFSGENSEKLRLTLSYGR